MSIVMGFADEFNLFAFCIKDCCVLSVFFTAK